VTELTEQETALLKVLADEQENSGSPGFLETTAIAKVLEITVPDAKKTIRSLFVKGLVGTDELDTFAAYLLPEGYEIARRK
jgi:Mn-dependent DtxR family transcriptional regulator